jgi:hypothetical protein
MPRDCAGLARGFDGWGLTHEKWGNLVGFGRALLLELKQCRFAAGGVCLAYVGAPWRERFEFRSKPTSQNRDMGHPVREMWRQKGSEGWGELIFSGSFAALRMTAKTKETRTTAVAD